MTIKQQGGIFGRNPTFNDLTVEGSVSVPADSISGDAINGGTPTPISLAVNTTTALDLVHFKESVNSPTATQLLLQNEGDGNHAAGLGFQVSSSSELTSFAPKAGIVLERGAPNGGGALKFYNDGSGDTAGFSSGDLRMEILNSGNVSVTNGNLVMATSGTGIDFSATSGTGTSELFDDYEEGTWTPVVSDGTNDATMNVSTSGSYTKIGNTVFFRARARVSSLGSVSGAVRITGLPFTIANDNSNYSGGSIVGDGLNITAGQSLMYLTIIGANYLSLYLTDATTGISALDAAELSATGDLYFSGQYYV
jgi:hypothetical protein